MFGVTEAPAVVWGIKVRMGTAGVHAGFLRSCCMWHLLSLPSRELGLVLGTADCLPCVPRRSFEWKRPHQACLRFVFASGQILHEGRGVLRSDLTSSFRCIALCWSRGASRLGARRKPIFHFTSLCLRLCRAHAMETTYSRCGQSMAQAARCRCC